MPYLTAAPSASPVPDSVLRRRATVSWLVLAGGMYLASAAVVRLFDSRSLLGQTAQFIQQGGPMYRVVCEGCVSTSASIATA